jgi:hypothetical protein
LLIQVYEAAGLPLLLGQRRELGSEGAFAAPAFLVGNGPNPHSTTFLLVNM